MLKTSTLRSISLYATFFLFFSAGVESGVFLPSVVDYLHTIGIQHEALLGIVLACYWLGVCVSSRAMQLLVEASYNVQMLLMLCCILYIVGGMLYYLAPSMWAVIFSKIFSGLGCGCVALVEADLAPNTSDAELAALRSSLRRCVALGWLLAPVFGALSALASTAALPSEPGLVAAALFVGAALLTLLGFTDLARNLRQCRLRDTLALAYERKQKPPARTNYGSTKALESELSMERDNSEESCSIIFSKEEALSTPASRKQCCDLSCTVRLPECRQQQQLTQSDELLEVAEDFMGPSARLPPLRIAPHSQDAAADSPKTISFSPGVVSTPIDAVLAENTQSATPQLLKIIDIRAPTSWCNRTRSNWLCPQFLTGFVFGSIQTMFSPLTECYFLFTTLENSMAQLILSIFGLLPFLLPAVPDHLYKFFVVISCSLGVVATSFLIIIGQGSVQSFIACLLLLGVSCSLLFVVGSSGKSQQEFRLSDEQVRWLWCLGLVMGPLWTGSTVGQPKIMHSGHLVVLVLGLINCAL